MRASNRLVECSAYNSKASQTMCSPSIKVFRLPLKWVWPTEISISFLLTCLMFHILKTTKTKQNKNRIFTLNMKKLRKMRIASNTDWTIYVLLKEKLHNLFHSLYILNLIQMHYDVQNKGVQFVKNLCDSLNVL